MVNIKQEKKHEEEYYPAEEQGILKKKTKQERKNAIELGEEDEDIYSEEGLESLEEDDEIEPWEEGFMEGATRGGQLGKDALTGEPLMGVDDVIELELNGQIYRFTNKKNAEKFRLMKSMKKSKK